MIARNGFTRQLVTIWNKNECCKNEWQMKIFFLYVFLILILFFKRKFGNKKYKRKKNTRHSWVCQFTECNFWYKQKFFQAPNKVGCCTCTACFAILYRFLISNPPTVPIFSSWDEDESMPLREYASANNFVDAKHVVKKKDTQPSNVFLHDHQQNYFEQVSFVYIFRHSNHITNWLACMC